MAGGLPDLLRRRQFILGPHYLGYLAGWQKSRVGSQLYLTAHPDLPVCHVESGTVTLTLLGYVIDALHPEEHDRQIVERWVGRADDITDLFDITAECGGRWILIVSDSHRDWLFHDAAGLRTVAYSGDLSHGAWCASDAKMIANELGVLITDDRGEAIDWSKDDELAVVVIGWPGIHAQLLDVM